MRARAAICWICAWITWGLSASPLAAQAPSPTDAGARPADDRADPPPRPGQAQRNWLLAHLIVDHKLSAEQVQALDQKLANLSDDQVDVITRVYQQRRGAEAAAAQAELDLARENLDQLKRYRDSLANEVSAWRVYRQAQYLNFGAGWGGYGQVGYGGYGWASPYVYRPGFGFGGYGIGVYPGAAPYYGGVLPGYGVYSGGAVMGYPPGALGMGFGVY